MIQLSTKENRQETINRYPYLKMDRVSQEQCELIRQFENAPTAIEQGIAKRSKIGPQVVATLLALLTMTSFGFHTGWPSPTLTQLLAKDSDLPVTPLQGAWIVSFYSLGSVASAFIVSSILDAYGRKTALLLSTVPCFAGSVLIAFSQSYQWLFLARFIIGIGVGVSSVAGSMYIGEIAEDKLRGTLGASINAMSNIGLVLAYCIGPWVSRQVLACVGAAIPAICGLTFIWMPESPYFSAMKNKSDESRKQLIWLRGITNVDKEFREIQRNVELDQKIAGTFKELIKTPSNRRALLISIGLVLAQEFGGIAAVSAYSSLVFQASRADLSTNVLLIIIALIQLISGFIGIFITNVARRRSTLLISVFGSVVFLSSGALYFQLQAADVDVNSIFWLPVTAIVGFILSYTIGLGILPVSMFPEFFPCNVRAKGMMVLLVLSFVSTTIVTLIYEILADSFGVQYAFWFFAGTNAISGIFIYFCVPETKNQSLRDIQNHLQHVTRSKSGAKLNPSQTDKSMYKLQLTM